MGGDQTSPHEGIWQQTLREASGPGGTASANKTILVLGDRNCGKTSLVARLLGKDVNEFSKGLAVDYAFMEVKDEKTDETMAKVNIWQLEGEEHHADLLKYAINAESVSESLAIIMLDLSAPWNLQESLSKWLKVLEDHLRNLKLSRQTQDSLREKNEKRFQTFKLPAPDAPKQLHFSDKHKTSSETESSSTRELPPLPEGALDRNLGIPLLVVGCKSDSLETHVREHFMKDADFEYIQKSLRKTCLTYGAGLLYVSSRKDNNCTLLKDYLISVLYDVSFYQEPEVYEKDLVFVPIGWDSNSKIDLLELSGNYNNPTFSQVIFKPRTLVQREQESSVLNDVEDEQAFLLHLRDTLEKVDLAASKADLSESSSSSSSSSSPFISSSFMSSELSSPAPGSALSSASPLPTTPLNSASSRAAASTPLQTPTKGPVDIQSLNSFFSNLLERTPGKKPAAPADPSSPGSFT